MRTFRGPKLLFMPGLDGTGISFEPLSEFLASNVITTVIRYPTDRLLSFEETVECASKQMQEDQDIILAESFSGPVAVALIGSGRLKPKGLILTATFAKTPRQALMRILKFLPLEIVVRLPFPGVLLRYALGITEPLRPMWQRVRAMVPAKILAHRIRLVGQVDVREWLPKLTMPCCYIQATYDRILPASSVLDFEEAIPDLTIERIKGPHFILQTQPEASSAIINKFIELITTRSAAESSGSC